MNNKITLLYAEDETETRQNHILYLKNRYDFNYLEASDGREALALYDQYRPEIVLSDITMPQMNGLDFIEKIRETSPHTKVIVLTAHDEPDTLLQALGLYVVNYLVKPINRKKLITAIDMALATLPKKEEADKNICYLDHNMRWNNQTCELDCCGEVVALSHAEKLLMSLLSEYKNIEISAYDIYVHIWNDFEKEFSADSVRTLVKKLRKKLPDGILVNIYGGFYRLKVK